MGEDHIAAVSVDDAWVRLSSDAGAVLIDVRTIAEWAYVGLPDLSSIGKRPVLVEWQGFPDDRLNSAFVERLIEALTPIGADHDSESIFASAFRRMTDSPRSSDTLEFVKRSSSLNP